MSIIAEKPKNRKADPGTRRQVSVLFTDMVGYTAAVEKLGEESSADFTRAIYDILSRVVETHGGVIRAFGGDSIMAVFGMPDALEDAGLRACKAGVAIQAAMQDAADEIESQFDIRPVMRVGISSGSVVLARVEGDDAQMNVVGNTVNLASRIQSLAPAGGCLICDTTRRLVEWRVDVSFDGEHEIKGVGTARKLWRLQSIFEGATRFDASRARGLSPYVGRAAELVKLTTAFRESTAGLRVADIVAEPGLGKTRLIYEFLNAVKAHDPHIMTGHCVAVGQQVPFLPFIDVMRRTLRIRADDDTARTAAKIKDGLGRVGLETPENLALLLNLLGLDPPAGALDGLDGVLIGLRTRDLLPALLAAQCRARQVVLLIEDIHWIDGQSADILRKLAERTDLANLLILQTRRPEYVPVWNDQPSVTTLTLNPLDRDNIRQIAMSRLDVGSVPDDLVRLVLELAGGNPLFGEEILSFLIEQGALKVAAGQVIFEAPQQERAVPESMAGLLAARIDQLAPGDRALLQAAATIGRRFDPGLLSLVVGHEQDLGAALQRMQALDIVYLEPNSSDYMFKHVLLRDTVYQSLLKDPRSRLHLAIAEALEHRNANRLPEVAETLAYHYGQTTRTDLAFRYNAMAGAKSLGVFSLDQARSYFTDALAVYEADPACVSDAEFGSFLSQYALYSNISLDVPGMIELAPRVRPVLDRAGDSPDHVLFLHHYVSCLICNSRYTEAHAVQQDLSAMAERLGDPRSVAYAMVNELSVSVYCAPISNAEFDRKRAQIEAALAQFDDAYIQNFYFATVGWNDLTRGRANAALANAARMVADGEARNDPRALGYGTAMKALVAVVTDDHHTALAASEEAGRLARAEFEIAIAESSRLSALVGLQKPGARAMLEAYIEKCAVEGHTLFAGVPEAMLGIALVIEGRIREGLAQIENTIARREAEGAPMGADWNRLLLGEVYLQILSGEGEASIGVIFRNLGPLAHVMISGPRRIVELVTKAQQNPQFDRDGHNFARGEMILGLLCKLKRRKKQAISHLETAHRIISATGASPLLARIEDALTELRV